jgi:peptidoglycan/LPS O-acetylase OafA/YrhL
VVLLHVTASRVNPEPLVDLGAFAGRVAELGYLGVTFFFALSGFVLTWSASGRRVSPVAFFRRRFARVYPLHLATAVVAGLAGIVYGVAAGPGTWAAVLLLVQAWIPDRDVYFGLNGVSWSLSCEAFFYAVTPLLLLAAARRSSRAVWTGVALAAGAVLTASLVAVSADQDLDLAVWVSPWYSVVAFGSGMALALTLQRGMARWPPLPVATAALLASVGLVVLGSWDAGWPRSLATFAVLPAILLVLGAAARQDLAGQRSWLSRRWMIRLGEWSFALYLVHPLVMHAVRRVGHLPVLEGPVAVLGLLAFVVLSTAAAAAAYVVVERPAERWLRGSRRAENPAVEGAGRPV